MHVLFSLCDASLALLPTDAPVAIRVVSIHDMLHHLVDLLGMFGGYAVYRSYYPTVSLRLRENAR